MASGKTLNQNGAIFGTIQELSAGSFTAPSDGYLYLTTTTGGTSGNRAYAKLTNVESGNIYVNAIPNGTFAAQVTHFMKKGMTCVLAFEGTGAAKFLPIE